MRHALPCLALALAAAFGSACQNQAAPKTQTRASTAPSAAITPLGTGQITGQVLAPAGAGIVASGGGNVVASGGGNVVASGGGNIVAGGAGNYRLTQAAASADAAATAELPLAGTEVYLADAQGERVPDLKPGLTGPDGAYLFTGLDPAKAKGYQVVAMAKSSQGQALALRSLANLNGKATISLASTHATLAALKELGGAKGDLFGELKLERFQALTEGYARHLREAPPSVEAPDSWADWGAKRLEADATLKGHLTEFSGHLKAAAEELKTRLKEAADRLQGGLKEAEDALNGVFGKR